MNLSPFLAACHDAPDVRLTHFLCVTPEGVAAQYTALAVGIAWARGLLILEDFLNRHPFHQMGIFKAQWERAKSE